MTSREKDLYNIGALSAILSKWERAIENNPETEIAKRAADYALQISEEYHSTLQDYINGNVTAEERAAFRSGLETGLKLREEINT